MKETNQPHADPSFGRSFNVITCVSNTATGMSYQFAGYSTNVNNLPGMIMPKAVLVVGDKDGARLGGTRFDCGSIVLVEGTKESTSFRLATPQDRIVLSSDVTVFGKKYGKGLFPVPPNGKMSAQDE